tara:strand:+ start:1341 stop:1637 length:297 start_codon:yes stop_codon:yes gene_type:complete
MVVFDRRSDEAGAVNIGEFAASRRGSAAVSAVSRVGASTARAFPWRWPAGYSVADRAAGSDKPIGQCVDMDALPVSEAQRVVAGIDGGEVVVAWVVDA